MANPLTGDFDVVLQVSGGTVARLLASMHQNAGAKPALPSFPHSATVQLGRDEVIDGVQGTLSAQVSVPRIQIVDGTTDRFGLRVWIRARYLPDPGSEPLADWITGRVTAEYVLSDIDPSCTGWAGMDASKYLWFKVVEDSVEFDGTVANEFDPLAVQNGLDEAATIDKVVRQLRSLLSTNFSPTPHKVSGRFRRGSMMSLNRGGEAAIAIPLSPHGPQIGSIDQIVLGASDFGVALSADAILGQVQPVLDQLRDGFSQQIHFHSETSIDLGPFGSPTVLTVDIWYTVTLTSATVEWTGNGVTVRISGQAVTEKSEYNLTFDVTQSVVMSFDAGSEGLVLAAAGPPGVDVHYSGPFSGDVINTAKPRIQSEVQAQVQNVLGQAAGNFDVSPQKAELVNQLRTIDDNADAHFVDASFDAAGVVLLGTIQLSPRQRPVVKFRKTPEGSAYTAWESWVPGGRIDAFDWSWRWAVGTFQPDGSQSDADTFRLTRPYTGASRYLMPLTPTPLPGLDGMGKVCLFIEGSQVDPRTGAMVETEGGRGCQNYHWNLRVPAGTGLGLRDVPTGPDHPEHPEWGVVNVGRGGYDEPGSNTLVVHVGERFGGDTAAVLREGLAACRRQDAGLAVVVLFDDGHLSHGGRDEAEGLRELAGRLEAPMIVNEDVDGGWAAALGVPERREQPSWRLLSPSGAVAWMSDEAMSAEALGVALEDHMSPSRRAIAHHHGIDLTGVTLPVLPYRDPTCPPPPVRGRGPAHRALVFAMAGSTSSDTRLQQLASAREDEEAPIAVVVRGATREDAQAFAARFGKGVVGIPDPDGSIAEAAGVRYWPTSLTVDELGVVTAIDVGIEEGGRGERRRS